MFSVKLLALMPPRPVPARHRGQVVIILERLQVRPRARRVHHAEHQLLGLPQVRGRGHGGCGPRRPRIGHARVAVHEFEHLGAQRALGRDLDGVFALALGEADDRVETPLG